VTDRLRTLSDVTFGHYDFLDFGSGEGRSIAHCCKLFGASRGLGIDVDRGKVARAQAAGVEVVVGDILAIPDDVTVRFVSMLDFLEHLETHQAVREALAVAARVASDFIFIRHPSFEDEAYLRALGFKQFWTDWTGHKAHVLISDFAEMFNDLGLHLWNAVFKDPVTTSAHPSILPLTAPPDQHAYDEKTCGPKPTVRFEKPVFRQIDLYVPTSTSETGYFEKLSSNTHKLEADQSLSVAGSVRRFRRLRSLPVLRRR
jgi:SAM-dependent methyltransferase